MRDHDSVPDRRRDDENALDQGLRAAFPSPVTAGTPSPSILDTLAKRSGMRPRVALREEPSGEGDRPLKPLTGKDCSAPRNAGKYHIQGEVARGGVGVIFKSHDTELGRDVAMKLLHEEYLDNPDVMKRFVEEAQIGGQLQHPGIVPVYDLGLSGERPYFTMKLIKGQTLASLLEDRATPKAGRRDFLSIFEQVCQTMAYAHSRGVIHRDLKPANIMVGPFGEVQVVDWGMGKVLPRGGVADEARMRKRSKVSVIETIRSDGEGSKSIVGSVIGTPAYMPPEQANGAVEHMDERSDVFALGAVLCEILTGEPPYVGPSEDALNSAARASLDACLKRLAECDADPDLVALVRDCLMPAPAARPRDARKLAQRLAQYLASLEDRARNAQIDAARHRVQATAARRSLRLTIALAASVLVTLSIATGGYWWIERERQHRKATASLNIERALNEAAAAFAEFRRFPEEGTTHLTTATTAAERARALLATSDVGEELQNRVLQAVEHYRTAQDRAERAALEEQLVARLESIAEPPEEADHSTTFYDPFARDYCAVRDVAYRQAFMEYGLPLEDMDHNDAALALYGVSKLPVWLSALDDWALAQEVLHGQTWPARNHLLEIVTAVDENPFRRRWLDLLIRGEVTTESVAGLLSQPDSASMSASAALAVAARLRKLNARDLHLEVLLRAQRLHPDNFAVTMRLAQTYHQRNPGPVRHEEALRFFTAAMSLRPTHFRAVFERGHCADNLERWDEAIACYRVALEINPDYPHAHKNMGDVMLAVGDAAGAVRHYRMAIESSEHTNWFDNLGNALLETGDHVGAVQAYQRALQTDEPGNAPYNLPVALSHNGDWEGALAEYRRALGIDPEASILHNNLAWLLANCPEQSLRDPVEAVAHARRAVALEPEDRNNWNTLGAALYRVGEFKESCRALQQSLKLTSGARACTDYVFLAMAEHRLGNSDAARSAYRQAKKLFDALENSDEEARRLLFEAQTVLAIEGR